MDTDTTHYRWEETNRRLDDGVSIRVSNVIGGDGRPMDGWLFVSILSFEGASMYSGTMTVMQALTEIPFQLDRARTFDRALAATRPNRSPF